MLLASLPVFLKNQLLFLAIFASPLDTLDAQRNKEMETDRTFFY